MSIIKTLRAKTALLNVEELAALLRVNNSTVQRWARTQQIPFIKVGAVLRFDGSVLADWLERQDCMHPIVRPFLQPRAPGNPDEYQIRWEDLGELAANEAGSSVQREDGKTKPK